MLKYIKAEEMKSKRTFYKKLIVIAPIVLCIMGLLSPVFYEECVINWWYQLFLPGFISLTCYFIHQKEHKKLNYRAVYSIPINLRKVWISKNIMAIKNLFLASIILFIGMNIVPKIVWGSNNILNYTLIIGIVVIVITSLWEIPLALFLSKKLGLLGVIGINFFMGIFLNVAMVDKSVWILCPYTWSARLMCPILKILPNGLLVEKGSILLNSNVIFMGISMSILLFALLLIITSKWFEKQEVM